MRGNVVRGVAAHRAELQDVKVRFALADAALLEKDRPRGVELDPQRDQPHRNCKNDRGCQ